MNRRRFIKITAGAGALALTWRTWYFATRETWALRVRRVDVPVPNLPQAFDGLKIAHLSDLHVEQHVPATYVNRALGMVNPLSPDIIALTGDYLSREWENMLDIASALSALRARYGVFAVLGNHDYYYKRNRHVVPILGSAGIRLLRNASARVEEGASSLHIIGLDDPVTGHDDIDQASRGIPPGACKLFLGHCPDVVDDVHQAGGDLLLAGHTHGGQINLPFIGPPAVPSRYGQRFAAGLADFEGMPVFVTRGVGCVEPYLRFRCPPEVALLTLHKADWPLPSGGPETDLRPEVVRARSGVGRLRRIIRDLKGK